MAEEDLQQLLKYKAQAKADLASLKSKEFFDWALKMTDKYTWEVLEQAARWAAKGP